MNKEEFFLTTIKDLNAKIAAGDQYNLIKAAGILRQLVADTSTPLIIKLNNDHKIKLQFEIADSGELRSGDGVFHMVALEPNSSFKIRAVSLDNFLNREIISWNKEKYSVLDFIKVAANIRGGVHFGAYKDEKEKNLEQVINSGLAFSFNQNPGVDPNLALLVPIYNVLIQGLKPLLERLKQ